MQRQETLSLVFAHNARMQVHGHLKSAFFCVFVCSRRLASLEFIDNKQDLDSGPITFVVNSRAVTQPCLPSNAIAATATATCHTSAPRSLLRDHHISPLLLHRHFLATLDNGIAVSRRFGVPTMKPGALMSPKIAANAAVRRLATVPCL